MKRKKQISIPKKVLVWTLTMMLLCLGTTVSFAVNLPEAEDTNTGTEQSTTSTPERDPDTPGTIHRFPSDTGDNGSATQRDDTSNENGIDGTIYTDDEGDITPDKTEKTPSSDPDKTVKKTTEDTDKDKDQPVRIPAEMKQQPEPEPEPEDEDTVVKIAAKKTLKGKTLKKNEFSFILMPSTDDSSSQIIAKNDEKGNISFDELTFDETGRYSFTVREDTTVKEKGVTYDETVYDILVTIGRNGDTGEIESKITYKVGDKVVNGITFVNSYEGNDEDNTDKSGFIKTGDGTPILLLIALIIIFAAVLVAIIVILKRKNGDQNR